MSAQGNAMRAGTGMAQPLDQGGLSGGEAAPTTYQRRPFEKVVEWLIFNSRWIMAPFFVGLIVALLVLFYKFCAEMVHFVAHAVTATEADIILGVLALIDLTLTASLVLIVIFSGYENFVSRINPSEHPDWPEWMAQVDFAGLKQKLMASIVAISAIQVLKAFMNIDKYPDTTKLGWLVGIHIVFVVSVLVLALSDRLEHKKGDH
jgi:uncharacterized protein (TIGR00645 family)